MTKRVVVWKMCVKCERDAHCVIKDNEYVCVDCAYPLTPSEPPDYHANTSAEGTPATD